MCWYALLVGVFGLVTLASHGAVFLGFKARGAVRERAARLGGRAARPTAAGAHQRSTPRPVRVLVADDDRVARLTLRAMIDLDPSLELVALAEDEERAIELAAEHQPDIAVVDVTMPAGGGARATRQIRASSAETRVMALSAHDDRETVVEMLRAGAVGYLVKGTPPSELLATIRRTAMGESSLSPGILGEVVTELSDHLGREERESTGRRERADRIRQVLDQGLLRMAFQPIAELTSGDLVGFEALARFPGDPPRSPDLWFADAAELGMQVDLELAAIHAALASLPALPTDVALWANVSPAVVTSTGFGPALAAAPADRLVLEVTEHARVEDYAALGSALRQLRSSGLRLAIDDAGAGFCEPAAHRSPRPGRHQARQDTHEPHRGRPGTAGADIGADLVRLANRRDDRGRGDRDAGRGRGAAGARRGLRAGLLPWPPGTARGRRPACGLRRRPSFLLTRQRRSSGSSRSGSGPCRLERRRPDGGEAGPRPRQYAA